MLPKPAAVPPSQLPEEVKKKLAEKAKSLPGYRTKICNNYENEGMCQYDDMCHYAHGKELKLKYTVGYGNTGCGVFKVGIQKLERFLAKNQM